MHFKKRSNTFLGFALLVITLLTSGCQMFKPIEVTRVVGFKVAESKGFGVTLETKLELVNPNRGTIRITSADIEVWMEGQVLGKLILPEEFTLSPNTPEVISCHMDIPLAVLISSGKNMMRKLKSGSFQVQLKGSVKAHYRLFKKHIDIDTKHLVEL